MSSLALDVRLAFRTLLRRPGFAVVTVLTLALGVGASTTMFSVLYGVVLQPLPYPEPGRVVRLFPTAPGGTRTPWTGADFVDFAARSSSYDSLAGYQYVDYSMRFDSIPRRVVGASVTSAFFQVFRVAPLRGRFFSPQADPPGGARAVVLSDGFWRSRFAADQGVVGRAIRLDGEELTVVGVAPPGFAYPPDTQVWVASRFRAPESSSGTADPAGDRSDKYFHVVGRLREGVSLTQARQEGQAIESRLAQAYPETNRGQGFGLVPLHEQLVASARPMLLALFGAAALVLLVACANVANLLLARATGRTREMAVRAALGAGQRHIARQLLAESLLVGLLGGAAGVALSVAGTRALLALVAGSVPRAGEVTLNLPVLVFALGVSLLSGVFFGLVPLLWLRRSDPASDLRAGGGRSAAGSPRTRARSVLVAAELAICLMLLVGVGLLSRTLAKLASVDPGFTEQRALTAQLWLPGGVTPGDDEIRAFDDALLEKVRRLPGVVSAGAVLSLPVEQSIGARSGYSIEGREAEPGSEPVAGFQVASPGYFESLGIPVLRGRAFTDGDRPGSPPVMVVSEAFASRFFPGEDPIGRRIGDGRPGEDGFQWSTIVGVVGDTPQSGLGSQPRVEAYKPLAQSPVPWITLVLKTSIPPASLVGPLRRAVADVSPTQPVERVHTMAEILHESLSQERMHALLLGVFAALALLLAAVGLYGVMAFSVVSRSREIGIRIAVGAAPGDVVRLVLAYAGRLVAVGVAAGCAGGLVAGRLLRSFLFRVPALDLPSFAAAAATLSLVALLASLLPVRRALNTDPLTSLRSE